MKCERCKKEFKKKEMSKNEWDDLKVFCFCPKCFIVVQKASEKLLDSGEYDSEGEED